MATAYKILGQSAPTDTSNADLYTVPASTEAVVSSLHVANVTGSQATFRIFIREGGASAAAGNSIAYDVELAANTMTAFTTGLTLSATDVVTVQTNTANAITFTLFGSEIS